MSKQFCKHGHDTFVCGRYKNTTCKACGAVQSLKWHQENPEKAKAKDLKYKSKNPTKVLERQRSWRERNPDQLKQLQKNRWLEKAPLEKERNRRWRHENKGKVSLYNLKNQTNRNLRIPKFGQDGIVDFYMNCPTDRVVDHIIPLQGKNISGLHVLWNLQYLTPDENFKKGNRIR